MPAAGTGHHDTHQSTPPDGEGLEQTLHVADGMGPRTMAVGGVADHVRDVVVEQEAVETDVDEVPEDLRRPSSCPRR